MSNIDDGKERMLGFQTGAEGLKSDVKFAELKDNDGFSVHFEIEDGWRVGWLRSGKEEVGRRGDKCA
ncbi:MAG TPA: hypothetical protein VMW40_05535 [Candidatus Bathyarchaeia archaeon]|nr:hypothetical protein [Candidatus Bathyarchaeia archaeon]